MRTILTMLFVLSGLAYGQQATTPKPPPGVPLDAKPFSGQWFKVIFEQVDWPEAERKCEGIGGRLAVIPDKQTWDFVKQLTRQDVWLGANDEKKEGDWRWVDGSKMIFSAWRDGEPQPQKASQDYLAMSGPNKDWVTTGRSWRHFKSWHVKGYICEWKSTVEKLPTSPPSLEVANWDRDAGILTMKTQDRLKSFRVVPVTVITLNGIKSPPGSISSCQRVIEFSQAKGNAEALATLSLEGIPAGDSPAPAAPPKKEPTIRISMRVDSADVIRIQGNRLWIEHVAGNLPKDIKVDGVAWQPAWDGKNVTSAFTKWTKPFPSLVGAKVTVTKLAGRARSVTVTQQPEALNNHTLAVQINDGAPGAGSVEIGLVW